MEDRTPLFFRFEPYEVFGIEKTGVVGAVIGASGLAGALGGFGEGAQDVAGAVGDAYAFVRADTLIEGAAHPESAFIEVRQEFRADDSAKGQPDREDKSTDADAQNDAGVMNGPGGAMAITVAEPLHGRIFPFLRSLAEEKAGEDGRENHGEGKRAEQSEGNRPGHGAK